MNNQGLSIKLLTAFIAASAVLGATAAISCAFAGRSWDSYTLLSETRAAEIASASETARNIRSADAELLSAFAVRDTAAAEEYIFAAREKLCGIEEGCADNKYLNSSESIRAVTEATEELDSISELIAEGDLPRAGSIYFKEYRPKLRTAAEYAERVSQQLSSDSGGARRLEGIRSDSKRLISGIALLGISMILFFGLYIDVTLRKLPKPVPEQEEAPQNDKYETESEYDCVQFLSEKLSESEGVIQTLVNSINTLADGDPDAASDGIFPEEHSEALSAVRKMKARLRFISAQINRASEFVSAEALRVSDNAEELSAAAEEQSSAAEALSECSQNMGELISRSSDISERIRNGGGECQSIVRDCSQRLTETDGFMSELRSSLDELNALAAAAAEIASKANLLAVSTAMNVSKGELSGASLAASADEARSLAIRSEEVSSEAERIKESCGRSFSSAAEGMENAGSSVCKLEDSLGGILTDTEEMSALNSEQSQAVMAVRDDLDKITGFVHLSKNAYEEYAASGRMLTEQTAALKKIMPVKQED
ncbi:MAG: methyl-accepting chemotaxis protein [Oscillospiraceae bacterium]|nr:methyl-accepting chemotaxis protein [Oscillospiraceae bacterium]